MNTKRKTVFLTLMLFALPLTLASSVVMDIDAEAGSIDVNVANSNADVNFKGAGEFEGTFESVQAGSYLDTNVEMDSTTGGSLAFVGNQALSGYTNNLIRAETFAYGDTASMNNRYDNSNYVVGLSRVNTGRNFLSASGSDYGAGYKMQVVDATTGLSDAGSVNELYGNGAGSFDTNQWHSTAVGSYGWGNGDSVNLPSKPGYYTPTNTVSASGVGTLYNTVYGSNAELLLDLNADGVDVDVNGLFTGTVNTAVSFSNLLSGSFGNWAR